MNDRIFRVRVGCDNAAIPGRRKGVFVGRTGFIFTAAIAVIAVTGFMLAVWYRFHDWVPKITIGAIQLTPEHKVPRGRDQSKGPKAVFADELYRARWVAYSPTNFDPTAMPAVPPSEANIRRDLQVLREAGFDGLVTYGADVPSVPRVAEEVGFRWLLLGVWNPGEHDEMKHTEEAARSPHVLGIIVGNEGLMFGRYQLSQLRAAMEEMKRETGKPVSTTEVIEEYYTKPELARWSDFLAVNTHPFFHALTEPQRAADWTTMAYQRLAERYPDKPILFKEVGLPTEGADGLSEEAQAEYYSLLRRSDIRFCYFEAFDSVWKKDSEIETHWGLFRADRTPKIVARELSGGRL